MANNIIVLIFMNILATNIIVLIFMNILAANTIVLMFMNISLVSLHPRINLSPFTKDFR